MSINIRISFNIFTNRMQWKWMNYCYMPQHRRISENNTEMKRPHIKSKYYMIPFTWSTKAGQMIHDIWNNDSSYLRKEVGTKWGKGDFCSASNMIFLDLSVGYMGCSLYENLLSCILSVQFNKFFWAFLYTLCLINT